MVSIAVFCKEKQKMATFDINATVGPIIYGVVDLMPSMLALVVAVVPVVLTLAVVGFILKFWDQIIKMISF